MYGDSTSGLDIAAGAANGDTRPQLTPEQNAKIEQAITEFIQTQDLLQRADVPRLQSLRLFESGQQYTFYSGGVWMKAAFGNKTESLSAVNNYTKTLCTTWHSLLRRGEPSVSFKSIAERASASTLEGVNRMVKAELEMAEFAAAHSRFEQRKVVDGEAVMHISFDPYCGIMLPSGQRSGVYRFEDVRSEQMLFDKNIARLSDAPMLVRVYPVMRESLKAMYGDWVARNAPMATAQVVWDRATQPSVESFFRMLPDNFMASQRYLLCDIWIQPWQARNICGEFPGWERGIHRIRAGIYQPGETKHYPDMSKENTSWGPKTLTVVDEYWPDSCVALGSPPYVYSRLFPTPVAHRGLGVPEMVYDQQMTLNMLNTGLNRMTVLGGMVIALASERDATRSQQNWKYSDLSTWVYGGAEPRILAMPQRTGDMARDMDGVKRLMEQLVCLTPSDFGRTHDEARAQGATLLEWEQERGREVKAVVFDDAELAIERMVQILATDVVFSRATQPDVLMDYFGHQHDALEQYKALVRRGVPFIKAWLDDSLNGSPMFQRTKIQLAAQLRPTAISDKAYLQAMFGQRSDIIGQDIQTASNSAQFIYDNVVIAWPTLSPEDKARFVKPEMITDPTTQQPMLVARVLDETGQWVEIINPKTAYDPQDWVNAQPYIEAADKALNCGNAFTYAEDQWSAAKFFMQCAQSRNALLQQNVQQTQQDLWKQGQSDKPQRAAFAEVGASA